MERLIVGHSWSDNEQSRGCCRDGPFKLERARALRLRTVAPATRRDVRGSQVIGPCPEGPCWFDRLAGWKKLRELLGGMEHDGTLPHLYRRYVEPAPGGKFDGLRNSKDAHERAVIPNHELNPRHRGSERRSVTHADARPGGILPARPLVQNAVGRDRQVWARIRWPRSGYRHGLSARICTSSVTRGPAPAGGRAGPSARTGAHLGSRRSSSLPVASYTMISLSSLSAGMSVGA